MSDAFEEIRELVKTIRPRAFYSRLDYWLRGSLPAGGLSERVGGSREPKMPAFDRTDQAILRAKMEYRDCIDAFLNAMSLGNHKAALRFLRTAAGLEAAWLIPIDLAPKELRELVSDSPSCKTCGKTKEQFEREFKKTHFRLKGGECNACYLTTRKARLDVLAAIDPEPIQATA